MEIDKQKLLIAYMLSNQELYVKLSPILKPIYFDVKLKNAVKFIQTYFEEYKAPPNVDQVTVETQIQLNTADKLDRKALEYAERELEKFCKERAMEEAIYASPALISEGKYGEVEKMIKDAITISVNRNLGVDYFDDPEARLILLSIAQNCVPTDWIKLDEYLAGGLNRKEMIIFAAPPGVGKSISMANISKNLMKRGLNGCYITLELAEEVTAKRFDSMFTGIGQSQILRNITEASIKVKAQAEGHGKLFIKRFPESSTTANHLRAYLKEFEIINGYTPDFMVVDYLDLMASCQQISAENTFIRDKYIAEELRAIANDYNLIMITASQLNRGAQLLENVEDLSQAHMAGGISKVNTADNLVAIIQTPQMKARGEMMYKLLKTRSSNGVGNFFMMNFDPVSLNITDKLSDSDDTTSKLAKSISSYTKNKTAQAGQKTEAPPMVKPKPKTEGGMTIDNIPFQV